MADIDNLVINVEANTQDAISGLDRIISSLNNIKNVCSGTNSALGQINFSFVDEGNANIASLSNTIGELSKTFGNLNSNIGSFKSETKKSISLLDKLGSTSKKATKSLSKMDGRLGRIVQYRMIRGAFNQVLAGLGEGISNVILFEKYLGDSSLQRATEIMNSLATTFQTLKNSIGSLALSIIGMLRPVFESLMSIATNVANTINQLFVSLQGGNTWLKATNSAYDYAKSLKEVKKQTFGFDELNILNGQGVNSGGTSYASMFVPEKVDTSIYGIAELIKNLYNEITPFISEIKDFFSSKFSLDNIGEAFSNIYNSIKNNIDDIARFVSGALLGVGAIMLATGNIGLGIGLIASSAINAYATKVDGGAFSKIISVIKGHFEEVSSLVLGSLICAGVFLLFTPMYSLGLGLLAAGLTGAVASIAFTDTTEQTLKQKLTNISAIAGASLLALGVLLLFSPASTALGIGMIVAGATGLATAVSLNWGHFTAKVQQFLLDIEDLWLGFTNYLKEKWNSLVDWYNGSIFAKIFGQNNHKFEIELTNAQKAYEFNEWQLGYADGGMPNRGSLFLAGEGYSAEIVGQFGGRTNVINQDQLTYSMREANRDTVNAIYAMANAIVNSVDNIEMPSIKIGDREIYNASQRGAKIVGGSLVRGV